MDEAVLVRVRESCGEPGGQAVRLAVRERHARREHIFERPAGQVLEHDEPRVAVFAVVAKGADVRMGEQRDRARLALEASWVGRRCERLHGHARLPLLVLSQPDRAQAAPAERLEQAIPTRDQVSGHVAGLS